MMDDGDSWCWKIEDEDGGWCLKIEDEDGGDAGVGRWMMVDDNDG